MDLQIKGSNETNIMPNSTREIDTLFQYFKNCTDFTSAECFGKLESFHELLCSSAEDDRRAVEIQIFESAEKTHHLQGFFWGCWDAFEEIILEKDKDHDDNDWINGDVAVDEKMEKKEECGERPLEICKNDQIVEEANTTHELPTQSHSINDDDNSPKRGNLDGKGHGGSCSSLDDGSSETGSSEDNNYDTRGQYSPLQRQIFEILKLLLMCFMTLTDRSINMCTAFGECGCLERLLDGLSRSHDLDDEMTSLITVIIYNCCWKFPGNRILCRGAIDVLQNLLDSSNPDIQAVATLTLSYIVDKSESQKITLNRSCVRFLLGVLKDALDNCSRRARGYSALETTQGLCQLAINDNNKRLIVEFGGLMLLERILLEDESTDEEKRYAARGIWQLAFIEENKLQIRQRSFLMQTLKSLKELSANHDLSDACSGALFVINDMVDVDDADVIDQGRSITHRCSALSSQDDALHIMVSYQRESQDAMVRVRDYLREQGYNVWMDIDEMQGDILDAMARAVQKACVVLLGITLKFKESQHCRTEATYAYTLKKDIIPLMLEEGYSPEDWLGALVGMRKFFPMHSDEHMVAHLPDLVKDLCDRGKRRIPVTEASHDELSSLIGSGTDTPDSRVKPCSEMHLDRAEGGPLRRSSMRTADIVTWDAELVREWLTVNGIETGDKPGLDKLDGTRLNQLIVLFKRAPEYCAASLERELGFSFWDVLSLVTALENVKTL